MCSKSFAHRHSFRDGHVTAHVSFTLSPTGRSISIRGVRGNGLYRVRQQALEDGVSLSGLRQFYV